MTHRHLSESAACATLVGRRDKQSATTRQVATSFPAGAGPMPAQETGPPVLPASSARAGCSRCFSAKTSTRRSGRGAGTKDATGYGPRKGSMMIAELGTAIATAEQPQVDRIVGQLERANELLAAITDRLQAVSNRLVGPSPSMAREPSEQGTPGTLNVMEEEVRKLHSKLIELDAAIGPLRSATGV